MIEHAASLVLHGDPPPGVEVALVEAADGVALRAAHWPAQGKARGAILLAQGRTEYIEKAFPWIALFQKRGLHVATFDFRGQGLSQRLLANRRKGYVPDFAMYQRDYDAVHDWFRARVGDAPLLVGGHSMGGLASARFLARRQSEVDGSILIAPMLGLALSPLLGRVVRGIAASATALGFGTRYIQGCDDRTGPDRGFDGNVLTHDRARFDVHSAMIEDIPDLKLGGTTNRWLRAAFREMSAVAKLPAEWLSVPTLVMAASDDTVVSNKAIARLAERNSAAQIVTLRGSRHEPMMEVDAVQDQLWGAVDTYLDDVLGPKGT